MAEEVILLHPPEVDVLNVWPSVGSSAFAAGGVAPSEWPVSCRLPTFRKYAVEWPLSSAAKDGTRPLPDGQAEHIACRVVGRSGRWRSEQIRSAMC